MSPLQTERITFPLHAFFYFLLHPEANPCWSCLFVWSKLHFLIERASFFSLISRWRWSSLYLEMNVNGRQVSCSADNQALSNRKWRGKLCVFTIKQRKRSLHWSVPCWWNRLLTVVCVCLDRTARRVGGHQKVQTSRPPSPGRRHRPSHHECFRGKTVWKPSPASPFIASRPSEITTHFHAAFKCSIPERF